jgi:hypothetical protein
MSSLRQDKKPATKVTSGAKSTSLAVKSSPSKKSTQTKEVDLIAERPAPQKKLSQIRYDIHKQANVLEDKQKHKT